MTTMLTCIILLFLTRVSLEFTIHFCNPRFYTCLDVQLFKNLFPTCALLDLFKVQILLSKYKHNTWSFEPTLTYPQTFACSFSLSLKNQRHSSFLTKPLPYWIRGSLAEKIWTITGKSKIEELNEDNLNFLFSQYELTHLIH